MPPSNERKQAAEAYISLGNVSSDRINEQYFRQALYYLRRANEIPGYTLCTALQQYVPSLPFLDTCKFATGPADVSEKGISMTLGASFSEVGVCCFRAFVCAF